MSIFRKVQEDKKRHPPLGPDPSAATRWNSKIDEAERSNKIMGDISKSLEILLAEGGTDYDINNDISSLTYTESDKEILRQFEGAAAPARSFSKFLQDNRNAWTYVLFQSRLSIQMTSDETFAIYRDKSHMDRTVDLRQRGDKSVLVKTDGAVVSIEEEKNYDDVEDMVDMVATYRSLYADDLSSRLGINEDVLPPALGIPTLLNPMFGNKKSITERGLMTISQYDKAEQDLLQRMHDILDRSNPAVIVVNSSSSNSDSENESDVESESEGGGVSVICDKGLEESSDSSSEDEDEPALLVNSNYTKAKEELAVLMKYRNKIYLPKISRKDAKVLKGPEINGKRKELRVGSVVIKRGKDLDSGKNIADYLDKNGRMDCVSFYHDHGKILNTLSTLWVVTKCESSRRVVEVGCERFFNLSGYVSSAKRTSLGVRNYERLAMLGSIAHHVYIDPEWVAREYLARSKRGAWKEINTADSLKCWNLERVLEAEMFGRNVPKEKTLAQLLENVE